VSRRFIFLLVLLALSAAVAPRARAALNGDQVFLQRGTGADGADQLTFINHQTGEALTVDVRGERYTLAGDSVLYFDPSSNALRQAFPDGSLRAHPFIQPGPNTRRLDWLLSPDATRIAWTLTDGQPESLTTLTTVAFLNGTNPRPVLNDGPRNGIRAMPVAFSPDSTILYMDFQPDGIGDFTPYPQYAGLIALDIGTGLWDYLPDEPGCFCGAGFGAGFFARLKVNDALTGFDLHLYNFAGQVKQVILAQTLRDYTQAGSVLISPDGTQAVYALAQVRDFGRPQQSVRTVFMRADLQALTQSPLTDPINNYLEPLQWTEDNSAVIFTSRQTDGTWKIYPAEGRLEKVSEATLLGTLPG
jgi:hypothetical protein